MGRICVAWVWNRDGTEKLVNGKQHCVWFVPTGMKGLPQNVLLNFRLEFPKSDLTIYLPSGISEIFCQMESTPGFHTVDSGIQYLEYGFFVSWAVLWISNSWKFPRLWIPRAKIFWIPESTGRRFASICLLRCHSKAHSKRDTWTTYSQ